MNIHLANLHPYPFESLRLLCGTDQPNAQYKPIRLSIGEPEHPAPQKVLAALTHALPLLTHYPMTLGTASLRGAIASWISRRHGVPLLDAETQILPVGGTREALFAIAQCVIGGIKDPLVLLPNPFYQIYEGAALLSGAQPVYVAEQCWRRDLLSADDWRRVQLIYVCSPDNPTGAILGQAQWETLFALSDEFGFVIISDECYGDIYPVAAGDDHQRHAPLGALAAAHRCGRREYPRLMSMASLSKRSSLPGLRSGFVAGNAQLMKSFLLYRTYHGCAMSPAVQEASLVAWRDEDHVLDNRRYYQDKFDQTFPLLAPYFPGLRKPAGGFYYWFPTPIDDQQFARRLWRDYNVTVLPGSFLARSVDGVNPGAGFVRVALTPPLAECLEAAARIVELRQTLS